MKTIIREIGLVDKHGRIHRVQLQEGLNIITGKSSTGKSALIEVFDYCFGGKDTIPVGVITNNTEIYYLYLQIQEEYFVIGRQKNDGKGFFKREDAYISNKISSTYFTQNNFLSQKLYKEQLTKLFIDISNVDESLVAQEIRGRPAPTPSIRSFTSFILQHQNLIANKHAIFYRFDEKEKREQVIEHTKIFLGFVNQEYFILSQEIESLQLQIKKLQREKSIIDKYIEENNSSIQNQLNLLYSLMGSDKKPITIGNIKTNANNSKLSLDNFIVDENIVYDSNKDIQYFTRLSREIIEYDNKKRRLSIKRESIRKHLQIEQDVSKNLSSQEKIGSAQIGVSVCPFCLSEKDSLPIQAEKLTQAIQKISTDLTQNLTLKSHLEIELQELTKEIKELDGKIRELRSIKNKLENESKLVQQAKSKYEQIIMVKASLFAMLDILSRKQTGQTGEEQIMELNSKLEALKKDLDKYNLSKDIAKAENRINQIMSDIGKYFDFEEFYKPIRLKFSLSSFELYYESSKGKIYLRSMGSGANWLYCHITLFLALHQYFIELGNQCVIPSILFLDQPTQVYFPDFQNDTDEIFDIKKLERKREIDSDIQSVTKLFTKLAQYCDNLKQHYGYSPQIIVTDHVDNLDLDGYQFEDFVRHRWRRMGFIRQ
ncbi:DUF3732 domain-containing protein [Gallibacterium melopsittaci]|uniref:DUF3732 domain-containing protein n=1 Tax=Gallibacterium melopsittaci TaxID=516063 RepID=A0ABV6HVZ9_9PAST